jgi:predicted PurR-regulated permease PerM
MHVLDRVRQSRELLLVTALVALVLGWALLHLAHILTPFIVAAVFAYLVHPLVDWLERRLRLPRIAVVLVLYLVLIGLLVLGGLLLAPSLAQQAQALATTVPRVIETIEQRLARAPELRFGELAIDTRGLLDRLDAAAQSLAERFSREAVPLVLATVEALIKSFVFFLVSFYGLLQGRTLVARLRALAPRRHQKTVSRILGQVDATFRAYIRAQLVLFAIMATATYIALTILEVKYRLALAIATGLLELIPFIGPWTAGAIAVSVALTQGTAPFGLVLPPARGCRRTRLPGSSPARGSFRHPSTRRPFCPAASGRCPLRDPSRCQCGGHSRPSPRCPGAGCAQDRRPHRAGRTTPPATAPNPHAA